MLQLASAARFSSGTPSVLNSDDELTVSLPIINIGNATGLNVRITQITFGAAPRVSPAGLPLFLGTIAEDNTDVVAARFDASGLVVGTRHLLSVTGIHQNEDGTAFGFTVNRYIVVPAATPPLFPMLRAHVEVSQASGSWTYTLFNDEPPGSDHFLAAFSLDIAAPVTAVEAPAGWQVETDNTTYVFWFAADPALPYSNHIAPGASLGGFRIFSQRVQSEATASVVTAWNHQSDEAGLVRADPALSPSRLG